MHIIKKFRFLFKDEDGNVVTRYVTLEEKIKIEEERKAERRIEIKKREPNRLKNSKRKHRKDQNKKVGKKLAKRLDELKKTNLCVKEELGVDFRKKKILP